MQVYATHLSVTFLQNFLFTGQITFHMRGIKKKWWN